MSASPARLPSRSSAPAAHPAGKKARRPHGFHALVPSAQISSLLSSSHLFSATLTPSGVLNFPACSHGRAPAPGLPSAWDPPAFTHGVCSFAPSFFMGNPLKWYHLHHSPTLFLTLFFFWALITASLIHNYLSISLVIRILAPRDPCPL